MRSNLGWLPAPHWASISCVALSLSASTAASDQFNLVWDSSKGKTLGNLTSVLRNKPFPTGTSSFLYTINLVTKMIETERMCTELRKQRCERSLGVPPPSLPQEFLSAVSVGEFTPFYTSYLFPIFSHNLCLSFVNKRQEVKSQQQKERNVRYNKEI